MGCCAYVVLVTGSLLAQPAWKCCRTSDSLSSVPVQLLVQYLKPSSSAVAVCGGIESATDNGHPLNLGADLSEVSLYRAIFSISSGSNAFNASAAIDNARLKAVVIVIDRLLSAKSKQNISNCCQLRPFASIVRCFDWMRRKLSPSRSGKRWRNGSKSRMLSTEISSIHSSLRTRLHICCI